MHSLPTRTTEECQGRYRFSTSATRDSRGGYDDPVPARQLKRDSGNSGICGRIRRRMPRLGLGKATRVTRLRTLLPLRLLRWYNCASIDVVRWQDLMSPLMAVETLNISAVRRDGDTQCRLGVNAKVVREYALQMEEGAGFPPVRVWFDGRYYWLSDGFHRIAALEQLGRQKVDAEVHDGNRIEAQWDGFGSNSIHGLRRSNADLLTSIVRAVEHPNATNLSQRQIAKHLGIPEATLRRAMRKLRVSPQSFGQRIVDRNGTRYSMRVDTIGMESKRRAAAKRNFKTKKELEAGPVAMKARASPPVRNLLNIFANWTLGAATVDDCLGALEGLRTRWQGEQLR
jgi:hypothetical protein